MRLDTIRARWVCFNSTAGVNWLKRQDSQFCPPGARYGLDCIKPYRSTAVLSGIHY
jgi:hypothetical protein